MFCNFFYRFILPAAVAFVVAVFAICVSGCVTMKSEGVDCLGGCISIRDVPDTTLLDTGFNRIVIYRIYRIPDSSKFKHKS